MGGCGGNSYVYKPSLFTRIRRLVYKKYQMVGTVVDYFSYDEGYKVTLKTAGDKRELLVKKKKPPQIGAKVLYSYKGGVVAYFIKCLGGEVIKIEDFWP